eukprot:TRINITY_DN4730_c0_g1_i1.p1 TRINITY_DN4730_c0_g1~~TRINITY_DN4730_c0_g1_i1.p1  ORF type:complete len:1487 (+),score=556.75 TRINITY_DN4730_c0_g1_i1:63-4523(+)
MALAEEGVDPHHWTAAQVGAYLRTVHLPDKYVQVFEDEDVNGMVFLNLTKDELKDEPFEIKGFGPIKTVLGAIQKLKDDVKERDARREQAAPAAPVPQPPASIASSEPSPAHGQRAKRASPSRQEPRSEPVNPTQPSRDEPPLLVPPTSFPPPLEPQDPWVPPAGPAGVDPNSKPWLPPGAGGDYPGPAAIGSAFPEMPPPPIGLFEDEHIDIAALMTDAAMWQDVFPQELGLSMPAPGAPMPLGDLGLMGDVFLTGGVGMDTSPMSSSPQMPLLITTPQDAGSSPDRDGLAQVLHSADDFLRESPARDEADDALVTVLPAHDDVHEPEEELLPLTDTAKAMVLAHTKSGAGKWPVVGKEFTLDDWRDKNTKKKVVADVLGVEPLGSDAMAPLPKFTEIPPTDLNDPPSNWMDDDKRVNPKYNPGTISYPTKEFKVGGLSIAALESSGAAKASPRAADVIAPADTLKKLFTVPYSNSDLCFSVHRVGPSLVIEAGGNNADTDQDLMLSKLLYYSILTEDHNGKKGDAASSEAGAPGPSRTSSVGDAAALFGKGQPLPSQSPFCTPETAPQAPPDTVQLDEWHLLGEAESTASTPLNPWKTQLSPTFLEGGALDASLSSVPSGVAREMTPKKKYPPAPPTFYRNLKWHFKDMEIVLGSDQLVMQKEQGREVAVKLRSVDQPLGPSDALEMWLDNVMNNVPEVAICYHKDGVTQGYQLVNTAELPSFHGDASFEPQVVQEYAGNVLHWLKDNCTRDAGSYILVREGSTTLKLYDLSALCGDVEDGDAAAAGGTALLGPPSKSKALVASSPTATPKLPFAYPVGMLCFRMGSKLAESSLHENLTKAIALLRKAIHLLPPETQPVILAEAHLHLANAYARHASGGASPIGGLQSAATQLETAMRVLEKMDDISEEAACRDRLIHCYLRLAEAQPPTPDGLKGCVRWIRAAEKVVADSEVLAYRPLRGALMSAAATPVAPQRWLYRAATRVHEAAGDFFRKLATVLLVDGGGRLVAALAEEMGAARHDAASVLGAERLSTDPEACIAAAAAEGGVALERKRKELNGAIAFDIEATDERDDNAEVERQPLLTNRTPAEILRRIGEDYLIFGDALWRRTGKEGAALAVTTSTGASDAASPARMEQAASWLRKGLDSFAVALAACTTADETELVKMCQAACHTSLAEAAAAHAVLLAPGEKAAAFDAAEAAQYTLAAEHVAAAEVVYRELQAAQAPSLPATPHAAPSTPLSPVAATPPPVSVLDSLLAGCLSLRGSVALAHATRLTDAFHAVVERCPGADVEQEASDLLITALRVFTEVRDAKAQAQASFQLGALHSLTLDMDYVPPGTGGEVDSDSRFKASERHFLRAEEVYERARDDAKYVEVRRAITGLHHWQFQHRHHTLPYFDTVLRTLQKPLAYLSAPGIRPAAPLDAELKRLMCLIADVLRSGESVRPRPALLAAATAAAGDDAATPEAACAAAVDLLTQVKAHISK